MWPFRRRLSAKGVDHQSRRLRFEQCEHRRMLTTLADVVFLIDESASVSGAIETWMSGIVQQLDTTLRATNDIDVRYGVVGYGQITHQTTDVAHSLLVDTNQAKSTFDRLWSEGNHVTDLTAAVGNLDSDGTDGEDGWDAIEHAIAEYDFRLGAVPIFVLIQSGEGREIVNATLTRAGTLDALQSKNVILNAFTIGAGLPLFDLSPYGLSEDISILGVEAGVSPGVHDFHWIDTNTINSTTDVPTATTAESLQISFNGSNTGATGMVGSGKSILIGTTVSGGIGPTASDYSGKSVPMEQ